MKKIKFKKPLIEIDSNTNIDSIKEYFVTEHFEVMQTDHCYILYGTGEIEENLSGVWHLYFSLDDMTLESCVLHPKKFCTRIEENFIDTGKKLKKIYGTPQIESYNKRYKTTDSEWNKDHLQIKHFIQDRHGDEEGVYFTYN